MEKYFQVNVELRDVNDKGKVQKIKEQYMVLAVSCQEAEARVIKMFVDEGNTLDYTIPSIRETKVRKIIE